MSRVRGIDVNDDIWIEPAQATTRDSYGGAVRIEIRKNERQAAVVELDAEFANDLMHAIEDALRASQSAYHLSLSRSA